MIKDHIVIYRDNLKICGVAYYSDDYAKKGQKKHPAIIMSHGYLCSLKDYKYFAEKFCRLGYNVYTFNFCCGSDETDPEMRSDGDTRDLCIESEIQDLTAVFDYVSMQNCVNPEEIYLWGESQGALVSGLTAARLQEKVKKLIMFYPAVCIPDHARRGTLGGATYNPKNPPELMPTERAMLGRVFHDGVKDMDVYSELAKYMGKTLLIQGDCDSVVVPQYQFIVKDWFDKTDDQIGKSVPDKSGHRMQFKMVRGMDHWTGGDHKDGLAEMVRFFLEDKEEILTFRIIVTKVVPLDDNDKNNDGEETKVHNQDVFFTGYCESRLFTGTIAEGVDHQSYIGNKCVRLNAVYTFKGADADGNYCEFNVENTMRDGTFKPIIKTESESLKWLNDEELYAIVENGPGGPTIRIYK